MLAIVKNKWVKAGVILIIVIAGLSYWIFYKSKDTQPKKAIYGMEPHESIDKLKKDILTKGDIKAYQALQTVYMDKDEAPEFAVWALIMANKFNYTKAYFDVYASLQMTDGYYNSKDITQNSLDLLDTGSRKIALNYLIIASSKGDLQAKKILGQYYIDGQYLTRDTLLGKKMIEESELQK